MMLSLMKGLRCQDFSGRNSLSKKTRATLTTKNAFTDYNSLYADFFPFWQSANHFLIKTIIIIIIIVYIFEELCLRSLKKSSSLKEGSIDLWLCMFRVWAYNRKPLLLYCVLQQINWATLTGHLFRINRDNGPMIN